jgi:hypothetical protein
MQCARMMSTNSSRVGAVGLLLSPIVELAARVVGAVPLARS